MNKPPIDENKPIDWIGLIELTLATVIICLTMYAIHLLISLGALL